LPIRQRAIGMLRTTLAALLLTLPLASKPIGAGSQRVLPPLSWWPGAARRASRSSA